MQSLQGFVKSTAIIVLVLICTVPAVTAQEIQFREIPFEEAMATAKKTGKIILVDVRGPQKPPANEKVEQEVLAADSIAKFFREHCITIYVNMHSEAGKAFGPRLSMLMYPTYVFYDSDGDQLEFINAFAIAKNPGDLMLKARTSLAQAKEKMENTRSIVFTEKKWQALLEQAKKENKLIFLDAQTEWCRPCRLMAQNVFTLNRVADFYNENFINVTLDMEKGEGPALAKKYKIVAYPAFLFIDHTGKLVHFDDGYKDAEPFIEIGKQALSKSGDAANAHAGIRFTNASWQQMLAEAKQSGKLIFMDAYAVWCGPCKWMNKNVFPVESVSNIYNRNFVNAYIDMEKGEGVTLRQQYNVRAYPTYLYINGNGEVVHKIVGSCDTSGFIQAALDALSPFRSLQYFDNNYSSKRSEYEFIRNYAAALVKAYESDKANEITLDFLKELSPEQWMQQQHWTLINNYVTDATSPVFRYVVEHQQAFAGSHGEKVVEDKIYSTYLAWPRRYLTYPKEGDPILDETGYRNFMAQLNGSNYYRKKEVAALSELTIRFGMRQWSDYAAVVSTMLKDKIIDNNAKGASRLYGYADNINRFGAADKKALQSALEWAKLITEEIPGVNVATKSMYLELYATLLEKNGRERQAKRVRKEIDQQKLTQAKQAVPFQPVRIIPKQQ